MTNQPLVCQILRIMGYEKTATSTVDRKVWGMIQISLLLFSYLIANIVPFFSSLQGIIGSALAAPIMFGWPPVFFLCCVRMKNHKLERSDMVLCKWYLRDTVSMEECPGIYHSLVPSTTYRYSVSVRTPTVLYNSRHSRCVQEHGRSVE